MRDLVRVLGATATGGVSSKLPVAGRAWQMLVHQQGKKPVDSEMNLLQAIQAEQQRLMLKSVFGSGIASLVTPATSATANTIVLHAGPALLPVFADGCLFLVGDPASSNKLQVTLTAPPGSGTRDDFIWLECWFAEVQPTTSSEAASSTVYTNGGVGNATLANDLIVIDGAESSRRIQARWRIRTAAGLNKAANPTGLTDTSLLAQGDTSSPVATYTFTQDSTDTGVWLAGNGTLTAANALQTVDGYVYAVPLAWVSRSVGITSIPTSALSFVARTIQATNADKVDGFDAYPATSPTANALVALDGNGQFPSSVVPSTVNADKVDGFDASATPTPNTLLPLNGSGKYPNAALYTGAGNGLDGDTVDGFHASATPTANTLLPLDSNGKVPLAGLPQGPGNGMAADTVDGFHASATPTANTLLPLDSNGKVPNAVLYLGSTGGIDADTLDTYHASPTPTANTILVLDNSARFPNSALRTGVGNGLDADLLDGNHASAFAAASHTHSMPAPVLINASPGSSVTGSAYTQLYSFTVTTAQACSAMLSMQANVTVSNTSNFWDVQVFVNGSEATSFNPIHAAGTSEQGSGGIIALSAGSNTISIRGKTGGSGTTMTLNQLRASVLSNYLT